MNIILIKKMEGLDRNMGSKSKSHDSSDDEKMQKRDLEWRKKMKMMFLVQKVILSPVVTT